jgi:CRISPR-associated protein Cas5h
MQKLISVDLKADFGFFRKPDANAGINLSYNMMHKPALLGFLGAVIGEAGYQELGKVPAYAIALQDVKIGVEPLQHEKGNFAKTVVKYSNTIGYANKGTNYLTEEAMLIAPSYRCYLLLELENATHQKLYEYLQAGKAEYLPYFGKNEFYAWWDTETFREYAFEANADKQESFRIKTIFRKESPIKNQKEEAFLDFFNFDDEPTYLYFERLPTGFNSLNQYALGDFAFTTFRIKPDSNIQDLFFLPTQNYYVQLA